MMSVIQPRRVFAVVCAIIMVALVLAPAGLSAPVQAQTAVAQSYNADAPLQAGMIVRLIGDKTKVAPVSQSDNKDMYGVVVRPNDAPLSLSESETAQQVYVATSGTYQVLVSDQNGPVKEGDYIVVSAIEGVGMKYNSKSEYVIGKALNNFDASSTVLSKMTIKDAAGNQRTVSLGSIQTDININRNPSHTGAQSNVPGFLQKAADAIANKSVTAIRVYLSAAVVLVAGIVACSISYAGIRTSVIALGRNPLARKTIFRNMFRIITVALIILIAGLSTVYLILKL